MPELPEVETVRLTIWPALDGRTIVEAKVEHPDVVGARGAPAFAALLCGARFTGSRRRGKYLVFELTRDVTATAGQGGAAGDATAHGDSPLAMRLELLVHLRMTGKLMCVSPECDDLPHTHLRLRLDNGLELRFADTRRFGRWLILDGAAEAPRGFRELGPEPLDPCFDAAALGEALAGRRGKVKAVLLDQRVVAGIGNIYADEILHRAGLHPERRASELSRAEVEKLWASLVGVLSEAIGKGGTTIRDYVDGRGRRGDFVYSLRVYGRGGQQCVSCGQGTVERRTIAGRTTHWCPVCQAAPEGVQPVP
jgi:formamidopyrimidine-DNA glycosylase